MSFKIFTAVLFALSFAAGEKGFAQQASIEAKADAAQIMVGDRVRVFFTAQVPTSAKIAWPMLADTFNHLEITERGKIDTLPQNGNTTYKQKLTVTGFDSGVYSIPSLPFAIGTDTFYSTEIPLTVMTVAVDTTQPYKPIVEIMAVQSSWTDYLWLIILGVIMLTVLGSILYIFIKKEKKKQKAEPELKLSLFEAAMLALQKLDEKNLWQKDEVKEYYVELTAVVRQYIEYRFEMPALELTSDEILERARRIPELKRHIAQMDTLLRTADLAKFAKGRAGEAEHIQNLELARSFITATKPVITVTENQPAIKTPQNKNR